MGRRNELTPSPAGPPDLGSIQINSLRGKRVSEVADFTLQAGEEMVKHWNALRPIAEKLIEQTKTYVDEGKYKGSTAMRLLVSCSVVVDKMAKAAQAVLKASEAQGRLAILMQGGVPSRPDPRKLSEKERARIVIETVRRIKTETGLCPVCAPPPVEAA